MGITKQEKFSHYKNRLINEGLTEFGNIKHFRFSVIEYICQFPAIDPYEMAVSIIKDGYQVVYDDSAISKADNEIKERKVNKLLKSA